MSIIKVTWYWLAKSNNTNIYVNLRIGKKSRGKKIGEQTY